MRSTAASSRTSVFVQALPLVVGFALLVGLLGGGFYWITTLDTSPPAAKAAKADSPEEIAFQRAILLAKAVKATANDPASIEFFDATYFDDGTVSLSYRGKNAFNATIVNYAVMTKDGQSANGSSKDVATLWNKYVAGKKGHDITTSIQGAKVMGII